MRIPIRLVLPIACVGVLYGAEPEWRSLFNGTDLAGWTKTIDGKVVGEDPDSLVQVRDGVIHMYADVPEGTEVPFGVITSDREFSHYQLRFEYRWLGKKFPPREAMLRDAGLIYHVKNSEKIWPAGVECQVQEGDTGDLVLLQTGGFTWLNPSPDEAPEGQGRPGQLPETGGLPVLLKGGYVGRFEEADKPDGWNKVEVIVNGSESAVHIVNGKTLVRVSDMVDGGGRPLSSGKICLQLEGAEIGYRNIEIRELEPALLPDRRVVSLSAVKGQLAHTRFLSISNPGTKGLATPWRIIGADAGAFDVIDPPASLAPGQADRWTIAFQPTRGPGRYSAGLQVGDAVGGTFIVLQGIGLDAFEGKNEPPLQEIVRAFGIPLDVGGETLALDSKAASIGESVDAGYFRAAAPGKVRVTALARFSPPGAAPIGIFTEGDDPLVELGKLSDCTGAFPDAHQALLPLMEGDAGTIEFEPGEEPFGFYMAGHRYTSFTDPDRPSKAEVPRAARIYPVRSFQGEAMEHTWLVGFEEAKNGDYQDALLMIENVEPVR